MPRAAGAVGGHEAGLSSVKSDSIGTRNLLATALSSCNRNVPGHLSLAYTVAGLVRIESAKPSTVVPVISMPYLILAIIARFCASSAGRRSLGILSPPFHNLLAVHSPIYGTMVFSLLEMGKCDGILGSGGFLFIILLNSSSPF